MAISENSVGSTWPHRKYPSPFFDIGQTYLPKNLKELFRYALYFYKHHPIIHAACALCAEYPVTDTIFHSEDKSFLEVYKDLETALGMRQFQIEAGIDYSVFGNSLVSILYPFRKHLKCPKCGKSWYIKDPHLKYEYKDFTFQLTSCSCGYRGKAVVKDIYIPVAEEIVLKRWDPQRVTIDYNETTGKRRYYYSLSKKLIKQLTAGRKEIVEETPQVYIEAASKKKMVLFNNDNVFHFRRPTVAQGDMGWGMPQLLPALKDAYYLQTLKKGQEGVVNEHIIPMRVLFPQAASSTSDPFMSANIANFLEKTKAEIDAWRKDQNRVILSPLPLGMQTMGGDARALILHQEIRIWAEHIVIGMGLPPEAIFGGTTWGGTHPSMKLLQNKFLIYNEQRLELVKWVYKNVARFLNYPAISVTFSRFKMTDDLQRLSLLSQLEQQKKISTSTLLAEADMDLSKEQVKIDIETGEELERQRKTQIATAAVQGEAQAIMAQYQAKANAQMASQGMPPPMMGTPAQGDALSGDQAGMGVPQEAMIYPDNAQQPPASDTQTLVTPAEGAQGTTGSGMNIEYTAKRVVAALSKMEPPQAQMALSKILATNRQLGNMVLQIINQRKETRNPSNAGQMPLPEQRAPRRAMPQG